MAKDAILFRPRAKDTTSGVTRRTLKRLANVLDIAESEVIHRALARYARENLPRYEPDEGPLTQAEHRAISTRVKRQHGKARTVESLFDEREAKPRARTERVRPSSRAR